MHKKMLTLICLFFLVISTSVHAEKDLDQKEWRQLNQTADKVLQLVKEEKYSEAKQLMDFFSKQFLAIRYDDQNLSMTQLRLITTSYEKAMGAVTSASASHEERVLAVSEFRLVIDALVSEHHPLWKNTETQVMNYFAKMREAISSDDSNSFQHHFNGFLQRYAVIRPAIMIDLLPHQFQRIDSHVRYVERYRATIISDKEKAKQLKIMEEDFAKLYKGFEEDQADPSLWWVILSIGGTILLSLSYVGYKKYKGEKNKMKMKQ
ncbi:sporulation protein YpjB [Anaerobacillus isosaccharinicus]|uniref:Sporulation protein YpjB n=1 Tax=Anaerobacillus isosaccharinicus TaxID=1532552 RepID=A0A1S2KVY0_9BACI|nr:sporulation protein YpjB [Anaerobacillus isosaccharinicus]MBA5585879.1 sporulation protein YpjB [Anaerobacillus isosaccharinicus]QOY35829.1 sporulation protein YpjB [Anaerobacillus isosaccharinicus]